MQVYSHHSFEKTPDEKGFLLNMAKDLFRCGTGATIWLDALPNITNDLCLNP